MEKYLSNKIDKIQFGDIYMSSQIELHFYFRKCDKVLNFSQDKQT